MKNDNNLFFTCSLIEYIARITKNRRTDVVRQLADDFIQKDNIENGVYDNLTTCKYTIPDYWYIGEVFARLIEDSYEEKNVIQGIREVYDS